MIDLGTNNFLTFVRLDNDERRANLKAMYNFYKNNCENYTHIFIEDDSECKIHDVIELDKNRKNDIKHFIDRINLLDLDNIIAHNIGYVSNDDNISINYNDDNIYNNKRTNALRIWEQTSYQRYKFIS